MSADECQTHFMLKMIGIGSEVTLIKTELTEIRTTMQAQAENLALIEQQNLFLSRENSDLKRLLSAEIQRIYLAPSGKIDLLLAFSYD